MDREREQEKYLKIVLFSVLGFGLFLVALSLSSVLPNHSGSVPFPGYLSQNSPAAGSPEGTVLAEKPETAEYAVSTGASQINQIPEQERTLVLRTIDGRTEKPLGSVMLYIDGAYAGASSPDAGFFSLPVHMDTVLVRAGKSGYQDTLLQVNVRESDTVTVALFNSGLHPVKYSGPREERIDIVFLPSNTSFNCTTNTKVYLDGYTGGQEQFEDDVHHAIDTTFLYMDSVTAPEYPLAKDYRDRFNFYYFWDNATFGDAFASCSGTIPPAYWKEVQFADVTVLLYPEYYGTYTGLPCQPRGCTNPNGLGRVYFKVDAGDRYLILHEIGHSLFGLVDTYCGQTYYYQNDPAPNVWISEDNCRNTAAGKSWNPENCRQISQKSPVFCQIDYWRIDPSPDIMREGYFGRFGNASTNRITNILDRIQI